MSDQYDLYEIMEELIEVYGNATDMDSPWYDEVNDIVGEHKVYVQKMEAILCDIQRQKNQCQHLEKNKEVSLLCAKESYLHDYCRTHFTLYACARCSGVCDNVNRKICETCMEESRREAMEKARVEEERVRAEKERIGKKWADLEYLIHQIPMHPPKSAAECELFISTLSFLTGELYSTRGERLLEKIVEVRDVFLSNPSYALCMVDAYWPPPFHPFEFK